MFDQQVDIIASRTNSVNRVTSTVRCPDCSKVFTSGKAMGGHRRIHTQALWKKQNVDEETSQIPRSSQFPRLWSGFQSREHNDEHDDIQNEKSIVVYKPVKNLYAYVQGWGKTSKKCLREFICEASPPNSDVSDIEMFDENIKERVLMLSQLQRPDSSIDSVSTILTLTLELDGPNDVYDSPKSISSSRKRKFVSFSDRRYTCNICSKSFDNPQALGGHKSSHNKPPKKIKEKNRDHRCKICNQSFPTGMALGGHKRKHWNTALAEAAYSSSRKTSSLKEVVQPIRIVFNFDLNELPQADD
ncbi:hypothetical protein ACFE04_009856 [Oxalis oulophora]